MNDAMVTGSVSERLDFGSAEKISALPVLLEPMVDKVQIIYEDLALEIGLENSLMLRQIGWLIKTRGKFREGQWWTRKSGRYMRKKYFPFWSRRKVQRIYKALEARKLVIIRKDLSNHPKDDTQWFSLNIEGIQKLKSVNLKMVEFEDHDLGQNDPPPLDLGQNGTALGQNDPLFKVVTKVEQRAGRNDSSNDEEETTTTERKRQSAGAVVALNGDLSKIKTRSGSNAKELLKLWKFKQATFVEQVLKPYGSEAAAEFLTQVELGFNSGKVKGPARLISTAISEGWLLDTDYSKIKLDPDSEEARRAFLNGWFDD